MGEYNSELTPEDWQRIYEEEKARREVKKEGTPASPKKEPSQMTEKRIMSPIVKYGGGFILVCILIIILAEIGIIPTAEKPIPAPEAITPSTQTKSESLEYKLASIEKGYVSRDDIIIARFRSLLQQLDSTYIESKQQIADKTLKTQELLKDRGIKENLLNIMEGMNRLFSTSAGSRSYAEDLGRYIFLRNKGQSHNEAIEGLRALLQSTDIY
jgi:hypothetical protein